MRSPRSLPRSPALLACSLVSVIACSSSDDDPPQAEDAGLDASTDAAGSPEDAGADAATDAGHEGLVRYGDEWLTPEDMQARRDEERVELGWDFEDKLACGAFTIYSTATPEQTEEICGVADSLYRAYRGFFGAAFELPEDHDPMLARLFGTRDEFRDVVLGNEGWAEGLYDGLYCNMYYDVEAANPYHWFLHEATHQMNWEVAGLDDVQWLEEGIASYFGTSQVVDGELVLGAPDVDAYPVWWMPSWDLETQVIPLAQIVSGEGGPNMDEYFNYYYLEWWTLTHYLVHHDDGADLPALFEMFDRPGLDLADFEALVGDVDALEADWRTYVGGLEY